MKKLLEVLLAVLMVLSLSACANKQTSDEPLTDPINKIGVVQLVEHDALDAATQGFKDQLEKDFSNIVIDVKNAQGESANCSTIVNGFVSNDYDLIMANATPALQAAVTATGDIPILGTSVTDYGAALGIDNFTGLVGENVSGTSDYLPLDKQAQIILDLFPDTKTVGILYCSSEDNSKFQAEEVTKYLESKGIKVINDDTFTDSNDVGLVTERLCDKVDVIFIPTDNQAASCAETINNITLEKKVPVICGEEGICAKCGVATLTIDYYELGVLTAKMARQILIGEKNIEEMTIEYFENPVKKYNPEIASALGIDIPSDFIAIEQ